MPSGTCARRGPNYDGAMAQERAIAALEASGIDHRVVRHGPVRNLAQAAAARGVAPRALIKSMVVRRGDGDYVFVLVPGDRVISWPKLRRFLGVSRLSMPDADSAKEATGFERGTITPFGSTTAWPVIADERIEGAISIGGGAHGVAVGVDAADVIRVLAAQIADITEPED